MCKEEKLLGCLCGLFHRSDYQDFDSLSMIPISGTILILQLLNVSFWMSQKTQNGSMSLISQIFKTFVEPHLVDFNALFHFPTSMKEADALILSGSNSMFVNFPVEDVYIINSYAHISLVQKLDHAMAHRIDFHFLYDDDVNWKRGGMNDYQAALELENRVKGFVRENNGEVEKTAIGWIILLSDSFVVHWSKQKESSMWICTVTICPNLMSFQHI